jgi:hypothetical protein
MIVNLWKRWVWCFKEYLKARTLYQIHSPVVFSFCEDVLEDSRFFYAFHAIRERIDASKKTPSIRHSQGFFFFRISQWFQADILVLSDVTDPVLNQILVLGNTDASVVVSNDTNPMKSGDPTFGNPEAPLMVGKSILRYFPDPDSFLRLANIRADGQAQNCCLYIIDRVASDLTEVRKWERIKQEAADSSLTIHTRGVGLVYTDPGVLQKQDFTLIRFRYKPWAFYDFF